MCLILLAWRSHPQHKLLVAANRDEFYARPTATAHFWEDAPHILAGRDLEKGGSWLGVTKNGRFAAVTNVRNMNATTGSLPGELSRGLLVQNFLDSEKAPADFLQALQSSLHHYSPFNLLVSDGNQLYYGNSQGECRELQPGVYGLSNAALDTPWPKVIDGKQKLFDLMCSETKPDHLFDVLADRQQAQDSELPDTGIDPILEKYLSARFIQLDGYGTRCSTVVMQTYAGEIVFQEKQFDQYGLETHNYSTRINTP
ncbi:MAG TPA: NRDE family protein [Pseudomonadales bacterium]|nr:NRDE family protein [Pseudomonadales bacterium]